MSTSDAKGDEKLTYKLNSIEVRPNLERDISVYPKSGRCISTTVADCINQRATVYEHPDYLGYGTDIMDSRLGRLIPNS